MSGTIDKVCSMQRMKAEMPDVRSAMNRMYRPQKLVYDLTRKYYLIGRDRMIAQIGASPGQTIVDIGCGTGRNLIAMRANYPSARLLGIEPSDAMLEVAHTALDKCGLDQDIKLIQGVAGDLPAIFPTGVEHVTVSYAISMMPEPEAELGALIQGLTPQGTLHIVDFGPLNSFPAWLRAPFIWWLSLFGVHWRPEVREFLKTLEADKAGTLEYHSIAGGYAEMMRFRKKSASTGSASTGSAA